MAFVRRGIGDSDSNISSGSLSTALFGVIRWVAIPCAAVFFASWSAMTLAGLHSTASLVYSGSFVQAGLPMPPQVREMQQRKPTARAMLVAPLEKSASVASLSVTQTKPRLAPAAQPPADPFGKVVADAKLSRANVLAAFTRAGMAIAEASAEPVDPFGKTIADAKLSREKLLAAFARAGVAIAEASEVEPVEMALAMPSAERFHRAAGEIAPMPADAELDPLSSAALGRIGLPVGLAYAAADAQTNNPVQLALASLGDDPFGMNEDEPETDDDYMPDAVELPPAKPDARPTKADARPEPKPPEAADKPAAPAPKPVKTAKPEPQQALAYARPDKPSIGAFKNLFNTPKAGKGVAIYDISAAVVHMPDGSKLEAHSGIGKMADNPRYVHVKMNGPTPPNTYKLSMREKRFHGVEAIRMTPIGDQTMHGRDGMLAHSYLLRGGREESHGCVAFANYPKFLKAFKQGKITHIVVVPSMSKMPKVRLASTGRET
jgi:hypothetical protein